MPRQMALVGKAGRRRHIGNRSPAADHRPCLLQPPHQQEAVRAGREGSAEMS